MFFFLLYIILTPNTRLLLLERALAHSQYSLNQINAFYNSNADESSFDGLLNEVIERHQALTETLQAANYSMHFYANFRILIYVQNINI